MKEQCPIHFSGNCLTSIDSFPVDPLIKIYKENYQTDVSSFLASSPKIQLYKCSLTGYRFFLPETLSGDSNFYNSLAKCKDYYLPWKWEFQQALKWLSPKWSILEIGSGNGEFLKKASEYVNSCTGIDYLKPNDNLNDINFVSGDYADFIKSTSEKFDCILLFQVLEHTSAVGKLIELFDRILKPEGVIIISLPNNNSVLLKDDSEEALNFPPHHMGWWTPDSILKTMTYFGFKRIFTKNEPLQKYHFNKYLYLKTLSLNKSFSGYGRIIGRFLNFISPLYLRIFRFAIKGHSFISVYKKQ